jgi:putative nucleotidyltransferase with HDIG domain
MTEILNCEREPSSLFNLIPISFSTLLPGVKLGLDIFILGGDDAEPILYCSADEEIDPEKLEQLARKGTVVPHVSAKSHHVYQTYLQDNWDRIVTDESLSLKTRVTVVSEVSRDVLRQAFRGGNTDAIVEQCQFLSKGISKVMHHNGPVYRELRNILHHDYATFTHSVNVALYATLLAKKLGYSEREVNEISAGGLLHDIGKLTIEDRILRKPGKLDELEFRTVQKHPTTGFMQVAARSDLSLGQLMMVYQHHEKLDGTGYPVGVVGDEIHPWAKLCTVVDIYEALTSVRPYRTPMQQATALALLSKESSKKLDAEIVNAWTEIVLSGSH